MPATRNRRPMIATESGRLFMSVGAKRKGGVVNSPLPGLSKLDEIQINRGLARIR